MIVKDIYDLPRSTSNPDRLQRATIRDQRQYIVWLLMNKYAVWNIWVYNGMTNILVC